MRDHRPQLSKWRRFRAKFLYHGIEDAHLRRLARAIYALPDDLHEIYRLRRFEGLAVTVIAQRLAISEEQVLRHLGRAMALVTMDAGRQARAAARWRRLWPFRRR